MLFRLLDSRRRFLCSVFLCILKAIEKNKMDRSTYDKDLENILNHFSCIFCLEVTSHPMALRCNHFACADCLRALDLTKRNIKCKCREELVLVSHEMPIMLDIVKDYRELCLFHKQFRHDNGQLMLNLHLGHIVCVPRPFENNYRVNCFGETPLHLAVKRRRYEEIGQLLETVDINAKDFAGWTALHEAVFHNDVFSFRMLIDAGCLIDVPGSNNSTPLHTAITENNVDMVLSLLVAGADKNCVDSAGQNAMELAQNLPRILEILQHFGPTEKRRKSIVCYSKYVTIYSDRQLNIPPGVLTENDTVINEFDLKKFTHIYIEKKDQLSQNLFIGLVAGKYFLNPEFFKAIDFRVPIPNYNFSNNDEINKAIKKATINEILKRPQLFQGLSFYIAGVTETFRNIVVTRQYLEQLITAGGGEILKRAPTPTSVDNKILNKPFHVSPSKFNTYCTTFVLYDLNDPPAMQYNMGHLMHKPSNWLMKCILKFNIFT